MQASRNRAKNTLTKNITGYNVINFIQPLKSRLISFFCFLERHFRHYALLIAIDLQKLDGYAVGFLKEAEFVKTDSRVQNISSFWFALFLID